MIADTIIIHCSDTPNHREVTAAEIGRWHRERGFDGIGYHWVIRRSGLTEAGRPGWKEGAHCAAHGMNHHSIGVCMVGKDTFTIAQWRSLALLILELDSDPAHPMLVAGHRDFEPRKTCPNFDAHGWWAGVRRKVLAGPREEAAPDTPEVVL